MKVVLITGSRDWTDRERIEDAIKMIWLDGWAKGDEELVIRHGGARGADRIAGQIARERAKEGLTEEVWPAAWDFYGRAAGILRNKAMVAAGADICLAFIKDGSKGATDCAERAQAAGIPVLRYIETTEGS